MSRDIAVLPARAGSKGFPGKNRLFFPLVADFIDASRLFDSVIVTTDDGGVMALAEERGYRIRKRPPEIAGDDSTIKEAFVDLFQHCGLQDDDYLWLFYIPLVYRDVSDFRQGMKIVKEQQPGSISTFIPAKSHPFDCWRYFEGEKAIRKYIPNDYCNRQDYPEAWENYHYVFAVRVSELEKLNGNLLNEETYPLFLSNEAAEKLVELDHPADLFEWQRKHPEAYDAWLENLPDDAEVHKVVGPVLSPGMKRDR